MKYNDWTAVTVKRGEKRDVWSYTTFTQGLKLHQFLTAEKAAAVLAGLRSTPWHEKHTEGDDWEAWKFTP